MENILLLLLAIISFDSGGEISAAMKTLDKEQISKSVLQTPISLDRQIVVGDGTLPHVSGRFSNSHRITSVWKAEDGYFLGIEPLGRAKIVESTLPTNEQLKQMSTRAEFIKMFGPPQFSGIASKEIDRDVTSVNAWLKWHICQVDNGKKARILEVYVRFQFEISGSLPVGSRDSSELSSLLFSKKALPKENLLSSEVVEFTER